MEHSKEQNSGRNSPSGRTTTEHIVVSMEPQKTVVKGFEQKNFADFKEGLYEPGDCGSSFEKPSWFDTDLYERGRTVLWDNLFV